jgi:Na+/melibiose symporter-like transporter
MALVKTPLGKVEIAANRIAQFGKDKAGLVAFATKVANGLGAAVGGVVYDLVGLTRGVSAADAPPGAGNQLGIASALLILAFVGAGVLCFRRYSLDRRRHAAIRAQLDARAEAT